MALGSKILLFLVILFVISVTNTVTEAASLINKKLGMRPFNNTISALFVFGDSTVDPGNNNYINTVLKCNFPPYGRDFPKHIPTGRFTNGRLVTDFIASYIGIKEVVPPYLDPQLSLEDLMTGVSFASGGSGLDPITTQTTGAIPLLNQLEYFKEYKRRLESTIGKERTKMLINKAAFVISCGTNDFIVTYFSTPLRRHTFTVSAYQHFLLEKAQHFLQGLILEGARVIGIVGLPPLGCVPSIITMNNAIPLQPRQCIDSYSIVGNEYNQQLQKLLNDIKVHDTQMYYADIYNPLNDMIQNPNNYGYDVVAMGCCGSGLFEMSYLCNQNSIVCRNASKYIFWDSVHPTQATYYNLFQTLRPIIDSIIKQ